MSSIFSIDLESGDPTIRTWALVNSKFWPIFLCTSYVLLVKWIGPYLMRNRKPYDLRQAMIFYNAFVVCVYVYALSMAFYYIPKLDSSVLCSKAELTGDIVLKLANVAWIGYIIKYVEFLDTAFFILRKRPDLVTNLHVIHHFVVPLFAWLLLRTERSGFQAFPCIINALVHAIMYSYYGLAAVGPSVRKYLWWKKYITIIQMIQFVLIFLFAAIITPLSGCSTMKSSVVCWMILAPLFFGLFFNYYQQSSKKITQPKNGTACKVH